MIIPGYFDHFARTCRECKRTFDLMDSEDAGEWAYGHDCEVMEGEPASVANVPGNPIGKATQ